MVVFLFLLLGCNFPIAQSQTIVSLTPEPNNSRESRPPDRPSPTLTPTPDSVFSSAEIYGLDWLGSGDLLITIETDHKITGEFYLLQGQNNYNCRISQDSDKLLFCVGQNAPQGKSVPITLFMTENDQEVFKAIVVIPSQSSSSGSSGDVNLTQNPTNPPGPTSPPTATSPP